LTARILSAAVYLRPRSESDANGAWAETVKKVTKYIDDKAAENPKDVDVMCAKAELADAAGGLLYAKDKKAEGDKKFDDAIAQYEKCVTLKPDGYVYLNNTAVLLSLLKRQGAKPVEMAELVIKLQGPQPEFIDTRGLGYLALGDPSSLRKAVADFTLAAKLEPKAVYFFHLAYAQYREALDRGGAPLVVAASLAEAKKLGLTEDKLHPLELDWYSTLTKFLNNK
jgi:tetratricopeptide (TPR) repeat protein